MSELNDVTYGFRNGNSGRGALNTDGISGYVMNGIAVSGKIALGAIKTVYTLKDVEALGINAAYDTANDLLVYHHLSRHFFRNPRVETYIMLVAQTVTLTEMADKDEEYAKKLLRETNGKIKLLGLIRNPASGYTVTALNGMDADSYNAIAKAQELVEDEAAALRLVHSVFLEIRSLSSTASSAANMRALSGVEARDITGVIIQDPAIAARDALFGGYAAVGDVLGFASKAGLSQNIGERTDAFQLQDVAAEVFLTCGLSSGQLVQAADLDTLMEKGYCFGHQVVDFDGYWLNDYPTSVALTDDYAYGYINRPAKKALQVVRKKILPLVSNAKLQIDPVSGKLTEEFRSYLEAIAVKEMEQQLDVPGDITKGSAGAYINPDTNVRTSNGDFEIEISFTEVVHGKKITLSVGLNPNA